MPFNETKRNSGEIIPNHDPDMNSNDSESQPHPQTETSESGPEPHSIYTAREKWSIVALIGFGGLFSPLSSNIYFPVIPTLSEVFHKSIELINLTVTMYIVFQGLAPMFWGTLADSYGRRIMFIACLLLLAVSCIGLALIPTNDYWLLLFLRCFQAAGSASTIALGAGVIGDISEPAERGGFFGVYNVGPLVGPAIGPVLGGALADKLGWRSIFWFLCIASAACALVLILFLPETLRALVGNGSIPPPGPPLIARPLLPLNGRHKNNPHSTQTPALSRAHKPFRNPLRLLLNLDILILLFFNGVICAVFYGVNASISTIFHETYPQLSETELGLCFLAIGGGMLIGSAGSGKLLDWDYQRVKRSILAETSEKSGKGKHNDAFPIEQARMRLMPTLVAFYIASCTGYGWCIEKKVSLAGPLILLIGVGIFSMGVMNATQTLILDLVPGQGSSVTACNNLVRCALSATMVACIQLILTPLGVGWTYTLLSGMCVAASPLIYVVMRIGPGCRAKRTRRSGGGEANF
ncbi:MFS general substrate transporter [Mycena alexandri]|uniref:MFS general substrate transporter n=1 Tax=Mycena alexandri TaxID=1745969 RepID=A0AAD6SUF6_9AGAR|nr:MFS general substrate transporter [Mycena alexandri]